MTGNANASNLEVCLVEREHLSSGCRAVLCGSSSSRRGDGGTLALVLLPLLLFFRPDLFDDLATLVSVPRACVGEGATALAVTLSTEACGQILGGDLLKKLVLVLVTKNLDLFDSDGVEPALDDGPDGGEDVRRVDNVELAHGLGIVVLTDVGGLLNVGRDLPELRDTDVLEIHDGARSLDELALVSRADGETLSLELFVLDNKLLDLAFWGGSVELEGHGQYQTDQVSKHCMSVRNRQGREEAKETYTW